MRQLPFFPSFRPRIVFGWIAAFALSIIVLAGARYLARPGRASKVLSLSTGKKMSLPYPGPVRRLNSFPTVAALSPNQRYLAILNNGYGDDASHNDQSIAILNLATGQVRDFPDPRLHLHAHQTYYMGLAWGSHGHQLYASVGAYRDPQGRRPGDLGNGIAVYRFQSGLLRPSRFLPIPLQPLPPGHRNTLHFVPRGFVNPFPAGLAVWPAPAGDRLLVAGDLSDSLMLLNARSGKLLRRFNLADASVIPAAFPYGVVVSPHGHFAYCSLWNGSAVARVNLQTGHKQLWPLLRPASPIAPGSHPTALLLSPHGRWLYVTLSNRDRVAMINRRTGQVRAWLSTRLPAQQYRGTYPEGLAQSPRGNHLYVADAAQDGIAVFQLRPIRMNPALPATAPLIPAQGFLPAQWYPTALAVHHDRLYVISGKGIGTGPNAKLHHPPFFTYIPKLIRGSVATLSLRPMLARLPFWTHQVAWANRMNRPPRTAMFPGRRNPIRHVVYIIKENRTYDQVFGDLPGNGDRAFCMYCEAITPNEHAMARQFGILDNFYVSAEVSADGHEWSDAAITSDYNEKNWELNYRGGERPYDFQGSVADGYPLREGIPNLDEPSTRYLWSDAARHGVSFRIYGEDLASHWCNSSNRNTNGRNGSPSAAARRCAASFIEPHQTLPAGLGADSGRPSPWPWPIPILAGNQATFASVRGHFDPRYPAFRLNYPDQLRADEYLREFRAFVRDRRSGHGPVMPRLEIVWLPEDHTAGTRPYYPQPAAAVADNDLALGRIVQAVSHSPYWPNTAIFVLEDDAQNGPDHVDAHRSTALVISAYAPLRHNHVDHHFYTTVNMIRTIEVLLGLPPMNNNDARASAMTELFQGPGSQSPFRVRVRNRRNGLIYRMNPLHGPGAKRSLTMDFRQPDRDNSAVLNTILWRAAKGNAPMPAPRHTVFPRP